MATTSVRLQQDPNSSSGLVMAGNPSSNGANACFLRNGDSLSVSIDTTSLPSTAKFTSIDFYPNGDERSADAASVAFGSASSPRRIVGYASSSPTAPAISLVSVSWNTSDLTRPVTITDSDSDSGDDPVWFAINVGDAPSGRSWRLDPEIVNTGGTKSGWQPAEAASLDRVAVAAAALEVEEESAPDPITRRPGGGKTAGTSKGGKRDGGKKKDKGEGKGKSKSKGKGEDKGKGKGKTKPKSKSQAKTKTRTKANTKPKSKSKSKSTSSPKARTPAGRGKKVARKATASAARPTTRKTARKAPKRAANTARRASR